MPISSVIFTMGKVGSSAIHQAIKRAGLNCHHIHTLTCKQIDTELKKAERKSVAPPNHLIGSLEILRELSDPEFRPLFVTLVRDPIEVNLSGFFTNRRKYDISIEDTDANARQVFDAFMEKYPHDIPLTWIDRQFKGELGLDILARKFDAEKKYSYYADINCLVIRADCPNSVKSDVLSRALSTEVDVKVKNSSNKKPYSGLYSRILENVEFPKSYIDRMYNSKFARQFWSDEERQLMRRRWQSK